MNKNVDLMNQTLAGECDDTQHEPARRPIQRAVPAILSRDVFARQLIAILQSRARVARDAYGDASVKTARAQWLAIATTYEEMIQIISLIVTPASMPEPELSDRGDVA